MGGVRAFFAVGATSGSSVLHAVDLTTGATVWGPVSLTGPATGCPALLAADSGRVFVQESGINSAAKNRLNGSRLGRKIAGSQQDQHDCGDAEPDQWVVCGAGVAAAWTNCGIRGG